MIFGDKDLAHPTESSRDDLPVRLLSLVVLMICAALVAWMVSLGG